MALKNLFSSRRLATTLVFACSFVRLLLNTPSQLAGDTGTLYATSLSYVQVWLTEGPGDGYGHSANIPAYTHMLLNNASQQKPKPRLAPDRCLGEGWFRQAPGEPLPITI